MGYFAKNTFLAKYFKILDKFVIIPKFFSLFVEELSLYLVKPVKRNTIPDMKFGQLSSFCKFAPMRILEMVQTSRHHVQYENSKK